MKCTILQRVALTSLSLIASLALSAHAGTPAISSASQMHGSTNARSINPLHQLLFPATTYVVDDGTAEDSVGATFGGDLIALNEFVVLPGAETITDISIAWGSPSFFDPTLDGINYTAVLWSDPNGDGNPADAVVLATAPGTVSAQGTDTFLTTNITPTAITDSKFFVGFLITHNTDQFPAAFDETTPTFPSRSYIASDRIPGTGDINNLNNNEVPVAPIENFGLDGNWLIQANGIPSGGGDPLELDNAASVKRGFAIDLPLTGPSGVEDRNGGPRNKYAVVLTFNHIITSVTGASTTCGTVQSFAIDPTDAHQVNINLMGVTHACTGTNITVTASGVTDDQSNFLSSVPVVLGLLIGDVNADRTVNTSDRRLANSQNGQRTNSSNFRSDIDGSGHIDGMDVTLVRQEFGNSLP